MRFARKKSHKNVDIRLIPQCDGAHIEINNEDDDRWEFCADLTYPPKRSATLDLRQWEIQVTETDTENLKKLKDLGYKEGAACRILDALGLE